MKPKSIKIISVISFCLSLVCLVIGASFHGYRMNPEDVTKYSIGVNMGIIMISLFAFFLIIGVITIIIYKKKTKNFKK
jgi:uncharacterized membrane protein YphA (DoxX/SURF4 family)